MTHVSKTDTIDGKELVPFLQSAIFPSRSFFGDVVDVYGEVPVRAPLAPDDAEPKTFFPSVEMNDVNSERKNK